MPDSPQSTELDPRPEPPRELEPGECCQNGCDPCVFDRYWEALERYEQALREWEKRQIRNRTRWNLWRRH